jgi:hypothetical protein
MLAIMKFPPVTGTGDPPPFLLRIVSGNRIRNSRNLLRDIKIPTYNFLVCTTMQVVFGIEDLNKRC